MKKIYTFYTKPWLLLAGSVSLAFLIIDSLYELLHTPEKQLQNYQYYVDNAHKWHCRLNLSCFNFCTSWPVQVTCYLILIMIMAFLIDALMWMIYLLITRKPLLTITDKNIKISHAAGVDAQLNLADIKEISLNRGILSPLSLCIKPKNIKTYTKQFGLLYRGYIYIVNFILKYPIIISGILIDKPISEVYETLRKKIREATVAKQ